MVVRGGLVADFGLQIPWFIRRIFTEDASVCREGMSFVICEQPPSCRDALLSSERDVASGAPEYVGTSPSMDMCGLSMQKDQEPRSLGLQDVVAMTQARVAKRPHLGLSGEYKDLRWTGVASLDTAGPQHISFFAQGNRARQKADPSRTQAGACFVKAEDVDLLPATTHALVVAGPYMAFLQVAQWFHPSAVRVSGVHPSACIEQGAWIDPTCEIGAGAVIKAHTHIGPRCVIGAHAVVGPHVHIASDSIIDTHASVSHAILGKHVFIDTGARIGQAGFGFLVHEGKVVDIPHCGRVVIEDYVRIGANTCIDRGSFQDTHIGSHTRIDNLVQIGHNVRIGRHVIIVAQCGIAGSSVIGDGCVLGGQVGIADHLTLAPGTQVMAKSGVIRSTSTPHTTIGGFPATPMVQWLRWVASAGLGRVT